jgi:transposase
MDRGHFWLTDDQLERLGPHLPTDTRGKPRVDDCRVISGIVHVLVSGCRWKDAPPVYSPRKTLSTTASSAGRPRAVVEHVSRLGYGRRTTRGNADRLLRGEGASLRLGWKGGNRTKRLAAHAAGAPPKSMC